MTWTLRRILGVIVALSSFAVAATLFWVTGTYQQFAIRNQQETIAGTVSDLVFRQIEAHERDVFSFINEWSRLSTLVNGMIEQDERRAQLAADRMMLTREVAEGSVRLRNVVIYSKDHEAVASARRGTNESVSSVPGALDRLQQRDLKSQRQITPLLWRSEDGRPLHSTIAPIGGFRVAGFVEFVTDPIPHMDGVSDALPGLFRLTDINGDTLFESVENGLHSDDGTTPVLDALSVPIPSSNGDTWAIATLTRDISAFNTAVEQLRNRALGIIAMVIVASVLIGWMMLRIAVFRRLHDFAAAMKSLANGNTDIAIPDVGSDEFAVMRTSLDSLRDAVRDREEAARALSVSEQRLRAIIDNTPSPIFLTDASGRYTLVNESFAARVGSNRDEMIGKTAFDYLPEEVATVVRSEESRVLQARESLQREVEFDGDDGYYVGLMVTFPVFDADGNMTGVGTIASDITDRKRSERELYVAREKAEEHSKLQRIILDNVGQGILVFEGGDKSVLWNGLATRFTGLDDAFLAGGASLRDCDEFQVAHFPFNDATTAKADTFRKRFEAGERGFVVTYQRRGFDNLSWVQVSLRSLADGMVVQTYQDISDLRQAIHVAQDAQHIAEVANRSKSLFLSNMSHELRTPLNAIIGFTDFVIQNEVDPLTPEQQESLEEVLQAGRHLLALIDDVLDLAKIEAGKISLSLQPIDTGKIIDECISLTASLATGADIALHNRLASRKLPAIKADRIRFKQVILNLLSNAIKYNSAPGNVYVELGANAPGRVRIDVRDDGPGIPEARLKHLFEPFNRLGLENSAVEGTGIGLTITRTLISQMGGNIAVDSVVGKGSTFSVEMPTSDEDVSRTAGADALSSGLEAEIAGRVLYIEDNPANLELVRKILQRQPKIEFTGTPTGESGIERARADHPDVILLDINLPDLNGFEVMEVLRASPETKDIPVVALTAAATNHDRRRGEAAGFLDYLTKPIASSELLATLERALSAPRLRAVNLPVGYAARVLVVDDARINLIVVPKQMARLGVDCDVTDDPERALEWLKTGRYTMALVDINMPVLDGLELTRRLRAAEQTTGRHTDIIALTATNPSDADAVAYQRAGMNGVLTKPVTLSELSATLHRHFATVGATLGGPDDAGVCLA